MARGEVRSTAGRRDIKKARTDGIRTPALITHYNTFMAIVKWYMVSGLSSER
jgi:hypothetical protein